MLLFPIHGRDWRGHLTWIKVVRHGEIHNNAWVNGSVWTVEAPLWSVILGSARRVCRAWKFGVMISVHKSRTNHPQSGERATLRLLKHALA